MQQMEFYFGDANLSKSTFMKGLMRTQPKSDGGVAPPPEGGAVQVGVAQEDDDLTGWISLDIFLRFNKLVDMLKKGFGRADLDDLWKALTRIDSDLIEVRELEEEEEESSKGGGEGGEV